MSRHSLSPSAPATLAEPSAVDRPGMRAVSPTREAVLLFLPLAFAALVYFPIAGNYFYSDDFLNLYHIANDSLLKYLVTPNGGHVLVARNAIFYLTARLFGPHPGYYYGTALLTHLVNVWLLFRVIRLQTGRPGLASVGAGMWGISPTNQDTLGWYAAYGHVLVATALLVILHQALEAAERGREPSRRTRALWYVLALAAATSFGTGIAVAMSLPIVLLLLLPAGSSRPARRPPLLSLVVVVPALYLAVMWAYDQLSVPGENSDVRRLLSGIGSAPGMVLPFWGRLVALGVGRLVFGFYYPPGLAQPAVLAALLAGLTLAAVAAAWRAPAPTRRRMAAFGLLLAACYGIIALGRAFLFLDPSKVMNYFGRYHYVGQLVAAILLCVTVQQLAARAGERTRRLAGLGWYTLAALVYLRFAPPIDQHIESRQETERLVASIRERIEAAPPGARVYIPSAPFGPLPLPPGMFPGSAAVFTIFFPDNTVEGREVRFVVSNPGVIEVARTGRRTATLLVPAAGPH